MDDIVFYKSSTILFLQDYYYGEFPSKESNDQLYRLIMEAQLGNIDARNQIVESMIRFIYKIAIDHLRPGSELDDLFQVGVIGCIKAIHTFKLEYKYAFTTYAGKVISNEIKIYLRSLKLQYAVISLDEPINTSAGEDIYLLDLLEDNTFENSPDKYIEAIILKELILSELDKLPERDRALIEYRFGLNGRTKITETKIGKIYDISRQYVNKLINVSLKIIRDNIEYSLH